MEILVSSNKWSIICWPGGCVWWFMLMKERGGGASPFIPSHNAPWGQVLHPAGGRKTHTATIKERWTCWEVNTMSEYTRFEMLGTSTSLYITVHAWKSFFLHLFFSSTAPFCLFPLIPFSVSFPLPWLTAIHSSWRHSQYLKKTKNTLNGLEIT